MPKRTRSHLIESESRRRLHDLFEQSGWVVWDLHPDYGEDFLVRIFNSGIATHYSFFVQAKATEHIDRYLSKDGKYLSFPIDLGHLEHWEQFWEPVVLTVWDAKTDTTYWEIIQDCFESDDLDKPTGKRHINIPTTNILTKNDLKCVLDRTKTRFLRFELACEGMDALVELVEDKLNARISYQPGSKSIMIYYYSDKAKEEISGGDLIVLDDLALLLDTAAQKYKMTPEQFFAEAVAQEARRIGIIC